MPNNSTAPASSPRDVVVAFLNFTIENPDLEKAKALLSAQTLASGTFHGEGPPKGTTYTIGEQAPDPLGLLIPVVLQGVDAAGNSQEMTMPFVLVQENGQWKLDLNASTERMFSPMMDALKGAAEQMGKVMGEAMKGVGDALNQALGGSTDATDSPPAAPPKIDAARLEKFRTGPLEEFRKSLQEALDAPLIIDIDIPSLLGPGDEHANSRILDRLEQDLFRPFEYQIRQVHEKTPLNERLAVIRFEPAPPAPPVAPPNPAARALFLDGSRLIYRLAPQDDDGIYSLSDLERILPPLLAGLPERIDPRTPPGPPAAGPVSWAGIAPDFLRERYREQIVPALSRMINDRLKHDIHIDIAWSDFRTSDTPQLCIWGLQRVLGALTYLAAEDDKRTILENELLQISLLAAYPPDPKKIEWSAGTLLISIAPEAGEKFCFYEYEIAQGLLSALKLAERAALPSLVAEAKTWEERLDDLVDHPITFDIDWDAFISHPDTSTNLRGLHILKEHGIDHLYYAVSGLAEKNPSFKQQLTHRVTKLRLQHITDPKAKNVTFDGSALVYSLAIHAGYDGYLTLPQLEKLLPQIVADMEDLPQGTFEVRPDQRDRAPKPLKSSRPAPVDPDTEADDDSDEDDQDELEELQELAAEDQARVDAEEAAAKEAARAAAPENDLFNQARVQFQNTLPIYASQMKLLVGREIPITIDWDSLEKDYEAIGQLIGAGLSPVLGGLAVLAQDPKMKSAIVERLDSVTLRRTRDPASHGFILEGRQLVFRGFLFPSLSAMDPQVAASLIRGLFQASKPAKPPLPSRKSKPDKKPTKSAKPAKTPVKPPAKKPKRK